jgi:hypothetical protein
MTSCTKFKLEINHSESSCVSIIRVHVFATGQNAVLKNPCHIYNNCHSGADPQAVRV